jgi:hypothetical protein
LITGSFQDIVDGKLNKRRRRFQILVNLLFVFMLPRFCFACSLYAIKDESTRKYYQYMIVDYMETLGLVGRSFNAIYAVNLFPLVIDKLFFRSHEASGKLEFLTEMLSLKRNRKWKKRGSEGLTESEKRTFLSQMHKKLMILKFMISGCVIPIHFFQTLGLSLFLFRVSQSNTMSLLAMLQYVSIMLVEQNACSQIFTLIIVCLVTVDYFAARIRVILHQIHKLQIHFTEKTLVEVLKLYDKLMLDFKKRNSSLRYLIRNMCYFYCPELSLCLFLFTVEAVWWMKGIFIISASTFISCVIVCELYVGHLQTRVNNIYHQLNLVRAKSSIETHTHISLETRMHLKLVIRELGSERKDGQHMIGLTNGEGAAFTTMDAIELTLATCSFTILIMMNVYYS